MSFYSFAVVEFTIELKVISVSLHDSVVVFVSSMNLFLTQIMIYLVDRVLPKEYFAHNLRALTVDMAVFRSYLSMKLPKLSSHLQRLQEQAKDDSTGTERIFAISAVTIY